MPSRKPNRDPAKFRREIWAFFRRHRRAFPWRSTTNPYHILVSEIMLQQTQTHRVVPKYEAFLKAFPDWRSLARAPLGKVLTLWSGLGYNRRARFLHETSKVVCKDYQGILPQSYEELRSLPGIGDYTAHALRAFAFDMPAVCIETNIRSVFIHYFHPGKDAVEDSMIRKLVIATLPRRRYREWFYALMDRGAALKRAAPELNKKSAHYSRQTPFKGSRREVRGAILKSLAHGEKIAASRLAKQFGRNPAEIQTIIAGLLRDKLIKRSGKRISLP